MIRYTLQCAKGHSFDAWFANSAAYDKQAAAGLLSCATCGNRKVGKAIMAPRIGKGGKGAAPEGRAPEGPVREGAASEEAPAAAVPVPAAPDPATAMTVSGKLREALYEMKRYVEANAENVGPRFAEEARRIHSGEAEERSIYGETTETEAEALRDEGIPFGRIPWPKTSDA